VIYFVQDEALEVYVIEITPGEMLKTLRELQSLTQKQLSELSGIPQSNLSALESGTKQIGRDRALALALALKVHPSVILFPDFDIRNVA
jgi:transcriptional regulator with XRE-family HTH domain